MYKKIPQFRISFFLLVVSFFLLHGLLNLIKNLSLLPKTLRKKYHHHKMHNAQAMTRQGLIEFSEGYWSSATKHLIKALPFTDTPLINYLTAARAAQELGENQRRDDFLREAQRLMPDTKIAIELTQAQLQIAHQQWEQAIATLKHLQTITPKHPYVLKLLMSLYSEMGDWTQLILILPALKKEKILSATTYEKLRMNAYSQKLRDLIRLGHKEPLNLFMDTLPKDLKMNPLLIGYYTEFLLRDNQLKLAETLLRTSLKKQFDDHLIKLYGLFNLSLEQLHFAETFLKKQPHSSALYLSLARLCLANQLWGRAQTYFEKSISLQPSEEAYTELGNFFVQFNNLEKACWAYKEALRSIPNMTT